MFKKIMTAAILFATTTTIATASTSYVGGGLGLTNLSIYTNGKVRAGAIAKLFTGYGSRFGMTKNIYLGGELNFDLANYAHYGYTDTTYGFGASFIPGVMLAPCSMLYVRAGVEADRYTHSSVTHIGSQLGFGFQTSLSRVWDIRGEYIYTSNMSGNAQLNLGLVYKL